MKHVKIFEESKKDNNNLNLDIDKNWNDIMYIISQLIYCYKNDKLFYGTYISNFIFEINDSNVMMLVDCVDQESPFEMSSVLNKKNNDLLDCVYNLISWLKFWVNNGKIEI